MYKQGYYFYQISATQLNQPAAASIVGIGRRNVREIAVARDEDTCSFDLNTLEELLARAQKDHVATIVCASVGEVNTVRLV